jgi:FkbM family methyltransferase
MDGILYSNTKFFEDDLNWTGVLIEPNLYQYNKLQINRPNNYLFNNLVSDIDEELEFKFFVDEYAGVSGVTKTLPSEHLSGFFRVIRAPQGAVRIKPVTFKSIIEQTDIKHFDFLSLDVEGHEVNVLKSWDFSVPIDIILIETLGGSQIENEKICHEILLTNNYEMIEVYKHNKIYKLKE